MPDKNRSHLLLCRTLQQAAAGLRSQSAGTEAAAGSLLAAVVEVDSAVRQSQQAAAAAVGERLAVVVERPAAIAQNFV